MAAEESRPEPEMVELSLPTVQICKLVVDTLRVADLTPIDLQNLAFVKDELTRVVDQAEERKKAEQTEKDLKVLDEVASTKPARKRTR